MYISFHLLLLFLSCLKLVPGFLKVYDFRSIIKSHISPLFFLRLVTPCYSNVKEMSILLRYLDCLWFLIAFLVSRSSLILSLFPIQILVRLRRLLRRNGIKCQRIYFEGMIIVYKVC